MWLAVQYPTQSWKIWERVQQSQADAGLPQNQTRRIMNQSSTFLLVFSENTCTITAPNLGEYSSWSPNLFWKKGESGCYNNQMLAATLSDLQKKTSRLPLFVMSAVRLWVLFCFFVFFLDFDSFSASSLLHNHSKETGMSKLSWPLSFLKLVSSFLFQKMSNTFTVRLKSSGRGLIR